MLMKVFASTVAFAAALAVAPAARADVTEACRKLAISLEAEGWAHDWAKCSKGFVQLVSADGTLVTFVGRGDGIACRWQVSDRTLWKFSLMDVRMGSCLPLYPTPRPWVSNFDLSEPSVDCKSGDHIPPKVAVCKINDFRMVPKPPGVSRRVD